LFTGICFLTFQTQEDCSFILEKWGDSFLTIVINQYVPFLKNCYQGKNERIKGQAVHVDDCPEPMDILWENLGTPFFTLLVLRIKTFFLVGFLLGISFGIILLLKWAQTKYITKKFEGEEEEDSGFIRTMLSLAITFAISFINGMLGFTLRKISAKEKYTTMTHYNVAVAQRIALVSITIPN
jgi:hypothetical protein